MKNSILFYTLLSALFFSCGQQKENNDYVEFDYDSVTYYEENQNENTNYQTTKTNVSTNSRLKGYQNNNLKNEYKSR